MSFFDLKNAVIVDTETTGLDSKAELCEVGVIDAFTGEVLVDTLIKPSRPIPDDAAAIHGISNDRVKDAPDWLSIYGYFIRAVFRKQIYAYNASFDQRIVTQTCELNGLPGALRDWTDVMVPYSDVYGEPPKFKKRAGEGRWQKLVNAATQQGIDISDLTAHRAVSDCEITRRLMIHMNTKHIKTWSTK